MENIFTLPKGTRKKATIHWTAKLGLNAVSTFFEFHLFRWYCLILYLANACGDTSNSAYDKLFKKNPRENFIEGKAKVTGGGVEVVFTCNEGTMKDVDFTALCYANKKGKLATQLLGSKSEKKAFKKCK